MLLSLSLSLSLFLLNICSPVSSGPLAWEYKSVKVAPAPRIFGDMASLYETVHSDISILFGGLSGGPNEGEKNSPFTLHNDTWIFNNTDSWAKVETTPPPNRYLHSLATTHKGTAVMFGGLTEVNENKILEQKSALSDIWIFRIKSKTWTKLAPLANNSKDGLPSPRSYHRLATFQPSGYSHPLVLMFGGRLHTNEDTDETWVFELLGNNEGTTSDILTSQWYKIPITQTHPSKRTGHGMSRLGKNSVVVFGGYDSKNKIVLGDTWVFIGSHQSSAQWTLLPRSGILNSAASILTGVEVPLPRRYASFNSFDAETAMLFGGTTEDKLETSYSSPFSDGSVWHLSRNTDNLSIPVEMRYTWRRIVGLTPFLQNPVPRYGHSSATVSGDMLDIESYSLASVFIFGGRGIDNSSMASVVSNHQDTWIFHGGCPVGTFRKINNKTGCAGCYACPIGTYKNDTGFTHLNNCMLCPTGTSTPWIGASEKFMCSICSFAHGQSSHKGQCSVDQMQNVNWECDPNYYGNKIGDECTKKCNCFSGSCDDGYHGTGTCSCSIIFSGSSNCEYPTWFVIGVMFLALLFAGSVRWYYHHASVKRSLKRRAMNLEVSQTLREEEHCAEVKSFEEGWKIDEQDLTFSHPLAKGGYGEVWKGKYSAFPGETVAIKIFFVTPNSDISRGAFGDREVALLAKTPPHKNIVFVIGAGQLRESSQIFLVSEFMSGGDLRSLLDNHEKKLTWERRLQIASDISEGMLFLHTRGMIHRDLKSLNILLDGDNGRAKIADFGLSKVTGSHHAILRQCTAKYKEKGNQSFLILSQNSSPTSSNGNSMNSDVKENFAKKAMLKMAIDMESELCRKHRLWFKETSQSTFKGSDAVSWLIKTGRAHDPRSAMALGTHLLQAGYFSLINVENGYESSYESMLDDKRMIYSFDLERLRGSDNSGSSIIGSAGSGSNALSNSLLSDYSNSSSESVTPTTSGSGKTKNATWSGSGSDHYQTFLTGKVGSLIWMAPEIMEQNGMKAVYGLETDVYSFGIVLYEIITRRYPWDNITGPIWSAVSTLVMDGKRPQLTSNEESIVKADSTGSKLYRLMLNSWAHDPRNRPNFDMIAHELSVLKKPFEGGERM
jgi:serine/threonine protein kinase